jgi:hypothetical protein
MADPREEATARVEYDGPCPRGDFPEQAEPKHTVSEPANGLKGDCEPI